MDRTKSKSCPVCAKTPADQYLPFCSARCADIDLGRWLTESYRVPTNEQPEQGTSDEENS